MRDPAAARGREAARAPAATARPVARTVQVGLLWLLLASGAAVAETTDVSVPIRIDYPLLQQLLARQLFTGPAQSRTLLRDDSRCSELVLTEPRLAPRDAHIEIQATVAAQLGLGLFGRCFTLVDWDGSVGFLGEPVIQPGGTSLGLRPQGLWLTKADGEKVTSGFVWDYARGPVQDLFSSFTIDLAPLTQSLASLLPDVLPHRTEAQARQTLDSLRLGSLRVGEHSLDAALAFTVEALPPAPRAEAELGPQELARWEARWQMMDALLVFAVKHYAAATQLAELRGALLDILIDSRYRLVEALAEPIDPANDVVRIWFVDSWQRLSPVVRKIALQQPQAEPLVWMGVLAAGDALTALDRLGPQVGFEISADGLRRLARMIDRNVAPDALRYDEAVDTQLQQLFEEQMERRTTAPSAWRWRFALFANAYAAAQDRLDNWVPEADEIPQYLPLVSALLEQSTSATLEKYRLDPGYVELFRNLVLATAWQESCWRQYVVEDDQIVPLRSSTGDVGLMQINERVWRGFYDLQKLRWDIDYNSRAGAEVLLDYLVKYAISRNEHKHDGGLDNLARASYSAYNGGPGKVSRYRSANASPYQRKVDDAFWKKYQRIDADDHSGIARCLGVVT